MRPNVSHMYSVTNTVGKPCDLPSDQWTHDHVSWVMRMCHISIMQLLVPKKWGVINIPLVLRGKNFV